MSRPRQRLLLVGAGHAHVFVLAKLARSPLDAEITLVAPEQRQVYSGMLPGWIAGHYRIEQCAVDLAPLARRAGVRWLRTHAAGLDPGARRLLTGLGPIEFDRLSIAAGSGIACSAIAGAEQFGIPLRPIERFIARWTERCSEWRSAAVSDRVAVIGGGAAGIETALAIAHGTRALAVPLSLHLVSGGALAPGFTGTVRRRCARLLASSEVTVLDATALAIEPGRVTLTDGGSVGADTIVLATGAAAPSWLQASGLARDAAGFIMVDPQLRSTSHPWVFAAGDCASMAGAPRPRSGVYAVRAGPWLARNLRASLTGAALQSYVPQRRALYLISAGDRYAIGAWGPFSVEGRWVWRWKDRIDRGFVDRFSMGQ